MRAALESDFASENIHHWIDLIFGYKQVGEETEKADNGKVSYTRHWKMLELLATVKTDLKDYLSGRFHCMFTKMICVSFVNKLKYSPFIWCMKSWSGVSICFSILLHDIWRSRGLGQVGYHGYQTIVRTVVLQLYYIYNSYWFNEVYRTRYSSWLFCNIKKFHTFF